MRSADTTSSRFDSCYSTACLLGWGSQPTAGKPCCLAEHAPGLLTFVCSSTLRLVIACYQIGQLIARGNEPPCGLVTPAGGSPAVSNDERHPRCHEAPVTWSSHNVPIAALHLSTRRRSARPNSY